MKQNFQALGDFVLIKKIDWEDQVVGGILVQSSQNNMLILGEVLSVGEGEHISKFDIKIGDIIVYNEIEANTVAADSTGTNAYFVGHKLIYGKKLT